MPTSSFQQIGVDNSAALHIEAKGVWPQMLGLTEVQSNVAPMRWASSSHSEVPSADAVFAEMQAQVNSPEKLAAMFSTCIRCHNCMTNCPFATARLLFQDQYL